MLYRISRRTLSKSPLALVDPVSRCERDSQKLSGVSTALRAVKAGVVVLALLLLPVLRCAGQSTVNYGETTYSSTAYTDGNDAIPLFLEFTTGSSGPYAVNSCSFYAQQQNAGTVECGIYSDNAGSPGSVLCHASYHEVPNGPAGMIIVPLSGCGTLPADSNYWVFTNTDDSSFILGVSANCNWDCSGTYPSSDTPDWYATSVTPPDTYPANPTVSEDSVRPTQYITVTPDSSAQAAIPLASPTPGDYTTAQTITLSDATAGTTICYTTDGSDPTATTAGSCSHGITYSTAISVSSTTAIKAIATEAGYANSAEATDLYTMSPIAFIQAQQCESSGTAVTCAFAYSVSAGDALMIVVSQQSARGSAYTVAVSDNLNGAWTQNGNTCFNPYDTQAETFYYLNSKGGDAVVKITSSKSTEIYSSIVEYAGIATTNAVDVPASCTLGSGTSNVTPSVTTTNANDLILGSPAVAGNSGYVTVASPYSMLTSYPPCAPPLAHRIVSTAGTYAGGSFNLEYGNDAYGITATYKAAVTSSPVSVSVSPVTTTLYEGQTQQFTAGVTNTSNTAVTWTISPPGVGAVDTTGLYTAPGAITTQQTITVTATSQADPSKNASAIVTLEPPVGVSISPVSTTLYASQTKQFNANVTNASNTAVTWSTLPSGIGTISNSGLYTAPAAVDSRQSVIVTATTVADPTVYSSASVTLLVNSPQIVITPSIESTYLPGQNVNLLIDSRNSGTATAPSISISVTNPDVTTSTLASFSLNPGDSANDQTTYTVPSIGLAPAAQPLPPSTDSSLFNVNLIVNGNAESASGALNDNVSSSVPGWARTSNFTTAVYGNCCGFPTPMSPGPANRGNNFFYGGPGAPSSTAYQNIDVSSAAGLIDSGFVTYNFSAWLGGFSSQEDNAVLTAAFLDSNSNTISSATLGPVTAGDRQDITELLLRTTKGVLPIGTRTVTITMLMSRLDGSDNDGYADNLAFVLSGPSDSDEVDPDAAKYLQTLGAVDNSPLAFAIKISWTDPANTAFGPTSTLANATEILPIAKVTLKANSGGISGSMVTYTATISNTGHATAENIAASITLPDGTVQQLSIPTTSLAPQAAMQATTNFTIPLSIQTGMMFARVQLSWTDAANNSYGPITATTGTAIAQLATLLQGDTFTESAAESGPYIVSTPQTFVATLKDSNGVPVPGISITFNATGTDTASGVATTDASGRTTFTYAGSNAGIDNVQASINLGSAQMTSNGVAAYWVIPSESLSSTPISGSFFAADGTGVFDATSSTPVAFSQTFPTIGFNAPTAIVTNDAAGTIEVSGSFTDTTTDTAGNYSGILPTKASSGTLTAFQAAFTGSFLVAAPGDVTFTVYSDDGFVLGIGNGAVANGGTDINPPQSGVTALSELPVVGAYNQSNAPSGGSTISVHFPQAGTYPYELDYATTGSVTPTLALSSSVNSGLIIPPSAALLLTPIFEGSQSIGTTQTTTVNVTDVNGNPVSGQAVTLTVTGANPDSFDIHYNTDANGTVTYNYTGANGGTDSLEATAFLYGNWVPSNALTVQWGSQATSGASVSISSDLTVALPDTLSLTGAATGFGGSYTPSWTQISGPGTVTFDTPNQISTHAAFSAAGVYVLQLSVTAGTITGSAEVTIDVNTSSGTPQGWIGSPIYGSTVTGLVPITVATGITIQSGTLVYYPVNNPTDVTVLNGSVSGSGQIGLFDTTQLQNGSYWIQLQATDSNRDQEYSLILVTVAGDYKPGRVTASVTDLVVPANGLSIKIQRNYDSLNDNKVGDFGYGWNLSTTVDLTVDPKGNVTFTLNGQRRTFYLAPVSIGFPFDYYIAAYSPEPGIHGTLTDSSSGCDDFLDFLVQNGSIWDCIGGGQYQPTGYVYTDPSGTSYVISATGELQGIVDKNGNGLMIGPNGITSSTGLSVPFVRDSQGRITQITDPQGNKYLYTYDSNGNLATVTYPGISQPSAYTYDSTHRYTGGTDARGNQLPTTTYYGLTDTDPNGLPLNGRLASVTNSLGQTTQYAYDLTTNTTTITYPPDASGASGKATMVYDSSGDLLSSTDPLGHTTTNTYDSNRNLISTTDPLGNKTTDTYDSLGNRTSVTYPKTATSTNTTSTTAYNQYSEPTSTTDELGNARTFTYDVNYNPESVTDADGTLASFLFNPNGTLEAGAIGYDIATTGSMASQFTYDADGNLISRTDALGRATSYTYNSLGQKTSMTIPVPSGSDASQATTAYTYDALGNLTQTAAPLGRTTSSTYDANGNKLTDTDALGHITTYTYDALNRLIKTTYPDSTTDTRTYDFRNNLVDEVDRGGHDTHYVYDLAGRLTSVTKAFGATDAATTSYTYDNDGRKTGETDPDGHTTVYTYDAAGNLTAVSGPGGTFVYNYDNARNRLSMTDGDAHTTTYQYDARKRLVTTTYPGGTFTTDAYDGPGNLISATDQAGNVVQYTYDAANQLKSVVQVNSPNSGQNTTSYNYDPNGNLILSTNANGHATSDSFDLLGDLTGKTLPDGANSEARTYDAAGNLLSLKHFNGDTTTYAYDSLDRLLTQTPDAKTGEVAVSFTYTPTGKRATMMDASGTTTYSYDSLDRLITKQTPEGTLNYTYDAAGNLASMTSGDGNVQVSYTWDSLNRLSTVVDSKLGTTTYTYDNASNVVTVKYPNGVQSTLSYDTLNRLTSLTTPSTGYLYQLGATGNKASATELSGRTLTWNYDGIYRLTNETIANAPSKVNGAVSYGLDPVGNRLSATSSITGVNSGSFSYNADDELANETYDADGNVLTSGGKTFAYDSNDRLKSMNGGAVAITYDGDGNRVAKTVSGVTTRYLVDDLNPTGYPQVVEETGSVERTYTYGLQRIDEDQVVNGTWTTSFYGYDGMGSVRNLTNTSGATTDTYEYDAFGNKINHTGTTPNNYLYRGEQFDPDLGLYYLRARYYNPLTGRFMSKDSENGKVDDPRTLHKYLYAYGDPINAQDPSGRAAYEGTVDIDVSIPANPVVIGGETALADAIDCALTWEGSTFLSIAIYGPGTPIQASPCFSKGKRGKWTCSAYCHVVDYSTGNTTIGPSADGYGSSETEACQAAQNAAKQLTPPGSYPRHCRCDACSKR
jgi:RHS repeat-associated protein